MPQFLNQRYNGTVAMIMAIFWLLALYRRKPNCLSFTSAPLRYHPAFRVLI